MLDPFVASEASPLRLQQQEGHRGPDKPLQHSPHQEDGEWRAKQILPLSQEGEPVVKRRPPEEGGRRFVAQAEERECVIVDVLCWSSVLCLSLKKQTHETVYPSKIEDTL